ncbi:MAG: hypothetical protein FWC20_00725 [Oscillospiraceae bacterium]|nr:hypothetical protein [Oscillospiraceae bacterium]MCL2277917.1 hypothetical protein [Oscillospiraceae bacterium]
MGSDKSKNYDKSSAFQMLFFFTLGITVGLIIILFVSNFSSGSQDVADIMPERDERDIPARVPYGATFCGWCSGCGEYHFLWHEHYHIYCGCDFDCHCHELPDNCPCDN